MNNTRGNTAEWRELLKLLKQAALAQAEPEEAVLQRLEAASRDLLQGFTPAAAVAVAAISSLNDRQEILELLLSTVKAVEAGGFRDIDYGGNQQGDAWCLAAAMTAAAMLADPPKDANSDRPAALEQQQLGWLVLFGRCCSYLHKHLQKTETTGMMLGPGGMLPPQLGKPGVDWYRLWEQCPGVFISKKPYQEAEPTEGAQGEPAAAPAASAGSASASSSGSSGSPQFAAWIAAVKGWLEASDTSAQLGAPGLSTDGLIKLLESTDVSLRCLQRITANSPIDLMGSFFTLSLGEDSAGMQQEQHHDRDKQLGLKFVTSLGQLGSALAVLPLSCGCNNPLCRNLEGVGEEEGGGMQQGSLCAACRKVRYCSKACQKQQWKQHRVVCKALAEAAAATPSA